LVRVLVTRPAVSAPRTAEKLRAGGHEPVFLPLMQADHDTRGALDALSRPHSSIAMTSAEAARVLALVRAELTDRCHKTLYAVGQATADAAAELGFLNIRIGAGTGLDLAQMIAEEARDTAFPILYLAGRPRSTRFEQHLREKALPFDVAEVYEMRPVNHDSATVEAALLSPPPDAVLLYSRENAHRLLDIAQDYLPSVPHLQWLCMSAQVAEALPATLHRNIRIAPHPDESGILALL
jgi:uroporphyrinogen-III synthase